MWTEQNLFSSKDISADTWASMTWCDIKLLNVPWTLNQSEHRDSSQSLQYLTVIDDFFALELCSQSCEEEAISFLKLNAIKIDYNSALWIQQYSLYMLSWFSRYTTVYWMSEWVINSVWCQMSIFSGWQDGNNIIFIRWWWRPTPDSS